MEAVFFKCIQFLTLRDAVSFLHSAAKNAALLFPFHAGEKVQP